VILIRTEIPVAKVGSVHSQKTGALMDSLKLGLYVQLENSERRPSLRVFIK
jgi:hypothetical protein